MSDTVSQASAVIEIDTECIHCGYNLRGLRREGRCPECGSPVDDSLRGNLLRHADPDWLDRVRFGASLKLWNIALSIVVGIGAGILLSVFGLPQQALVALALVTGGLGLWASFVITTQEPRVSLQEDPVTLRKVVRLFATLGFMGSILQNFAASGNLGTVLQICGAILALAGVVTIIGELVYFRRFARRIPDGKLERSTTVLLWAVPIAMAVGIVLGILAVVVAGVAAAPAAGAPGAAAVPGLGAVALGGFVCIAGVAGLVFLIWYIVVLFLYKDAFMQAAAESRAAAAGPGQNGTTVPPMTPPG